MSRRRVLAVDDAEMWLETISTLLESEYDVTVTPDPDEALAFVEQHDYSLAIIDQRLGGGRSGLELITQLQRIRPSLRAVILTGYPTVDDAVQSMSAGAVDYLSKASGNIAEELRARVERAVSQPESAFVPYLRARLDAQLRKDSDADYAPHRYVTHHIGIESEDHTEYTADDGVSTIHRWLGAEGTSFVVLLGGAGSGKTFFLHQLARRLLADENGPLPVMIPLHALDRPRTLDAMLTRHFADLGVERIDRRAIRELLDHGRLALLLDGLDELRFAGAHADTEVFLNMIVGSAVGNAKVVVTSREHVPAATQLRALLRERSGRTPGLRTCMLLPFTTDQINDFFEKRTDVTAPVEWNDVLARIHGLTSLATNPHALELIAALGAQNLIDASAEVSPAERVNTIYRRFLSRWLDVSPADFDATIPRETLWAVVTAIANRLWRLSVDSLSAADLLEETSAVMQSLNIIGIDPHALTDYFGTRTAVFRLDHRGYFSFTHRSIFEWLVANGAANELRQGLSPEALIAAPLNEPMYDFLVALAGEGASRAWAAQAITDAERVGPHATALAHRLFRTFPRAAGAESTWKPAFPWLDWLNGIGDEAVISRLAPASFRAPSLRIRALRIRNIRAFADTGAVNFCDATGTSRPTTLLLGDNAAGKSTVLQCLTIAFLGPALASQLGIAPERFLRHKARAGFIEVEFAFDDDQVAPGSRPSFFVGIELRAGEVSFRAADRNDCTLLPPYESNVTNAAPRIDAIRRLDHGAFGFLCAYGPWRNLNVEPNTSLTQHPNSVVDRVYSLFHSETLVMDPDLLSRILAGDSVNVKGVVGVGLDIRLAFLDAIRSIAPDVSVADDVSDGSLTLHGVPLTPRSLSDGYGSLVALVAHIFRHSIALSGSQSVKAIILVDEIDLHLHPSWQRRIVSDLARAFPQAQFVYTSHSPMVAGSTTARSIVLLKRDGDRVAVQCDIDSVQGWRADQILTSVLFDLESSRDVETSRLIQRYTQLTVTATLSDQEEHELRDLAAQLRIRLPTAEEKAQARRAFELIEATCRAELASVSISEREQLVMELQAQLLESVTQSRRPS
jgi:ActR/RegA family two-component response regulator/energy-coupling factor transporter ATP-binding protein EcfA2